MNCFIPDATMVGTIFVNAISNILTTAAIDVNFQIKYKENLIEEVFVGDLNFKKSDNDLTVNIGSIRYGQTLDFLVKLNEQDNTLFDGSLSYQDSNNNMKSAS